MPARDHGRKTPEQSHAANARFYAAHREEMKERTAEWVRTHPSHVQAYRREYARKRKYGLSEAEFQAMVDAQGAVCAICLLPPTAKGFQVDHDHKTGRIRGLLCSPCNLGVGIFEDDPQLLRNAARYLETR